MYMQKQEDLCGVGVKDRCVVACGGGVSVVSPRGGGVLHLPFLAQDPAVDGHGGNPHGRGG